MALRDNYIPQQVLHSNFGSFSGPGLPLAQGYWQGNQLILPPVPQPAPPPLPPVLPPVPETPAIPVVAPVMPDTGGDGGRGQNNQVDGGTGNNGIPGSTGSFGGLNVNAERVGGLLGGPVGGLIGRSIDGSPIGGDDIGGALGQIGGSMFGGPIGGYYGGKIGEMLGFGLASDDPVSLDFSRSAFADFAGITDLKDAVVGAKNLVSDTVQSISGIFSPKNPTFSETVNNSIPTDSISAQVAKEMQAFQDAMAAGTYTGPGGADGKGGGGGGGSGNGLTGSRSGFGQASQYGGGSVGDYGGTFGGGIGNSGGYGGLGGKSGGGGKGGAGRVICTYYFQKGDISREYWIADMAFTLSFDDQTVRGYHAWAIPMVRAIKKSKVLAAIWKPIAVHRANEIAYQMGLRDKPDYFGKLVRLVLEPMSKLIGATVNDQTSNLRRYISNG